MNRFPLLTLYRRVLQVIAVLVILAGFFISYDASSYKDRWGENEFSFMSFIVLFGFSLVIGVSLFGTAGLIQLGQVMEEHLYVIRENTRPVDHARSSPAPGSPDIAAEAVLS